ncbi:uncharacterized protein [Halyomorpha halys]|uniref:uncharacterized protein n=1 Tax=Halyomorpha halys TaxID=286706 RepID=UPI0034D2CEF3
MGVLIFIIPIFKISNPHLKTFLEKYTCGVMPNESSLKKIYMKIIYKETLPEIRKAISNGPIWIFVDETTDIEGRYIANIIVGTLSIEAPSKSYLLNCEILEKCNHETIARFDNQFLTVLWPMGISHGKVLLFLSDAAGYTNKAGNALKVLYLKIVHLTCLAHAFHRVAETVRAQFPNVDQPVSTVKKIFLKAPSRIAIFKETHPDLALPPEPVITRWSTWLDAAVGTTDIKKKKKFSSFITSSHMTSFCGRYPQKIC